MKKTIVIASNNQHKIKEFRKILNDFEIKSMNEIGFFQDIEENGKTFDENALIKAKAIHEYLKDNGLKYLVVADDSGLCVDALNGAPGVYSARYSGSHGDDKANRDKLQKELEGKSREAYFVCAIALIDILGNSKIFEGKTYGEIAKAEKGDKGFGYDCIFYSKDLNKTFGEATEEEKNAVSHRARAISKMVDYLKNK